MEIDENACMDACILYVIAESESGLTLEEITDAVNDLSVEEKLDAICRYQEHDPNP